MVFLGNGSGLGLIFHIDVDLIHEMIERMYRNQRLVFVNYTHGTKVNSKSANNETYVSCLLIGCNISNCA